VNETMARQYFNGQDPIGKRYSLDRGALIEIVGVVADAKYNTLRQRPIPMAYYPWRQVMPRRINTVILRSQSDPLALAKSARRALAAIHPDLPQDVKTLSSQIDNSLAQQRMLARLAGFFGLVSLLLACLGSYGVMAYGVATRTAEIGVRVALGAIPRDLAMMVLRETSLLTLAGIALGIPIALGLSRFVGSFLFGLKPNDPAILGAAALAMALVTVIAGYVPARRAANIDLLAALRHS
jgi:ABC-type antimicrobial peptide transport system permease subunit